MGNGKGIVFIKDLTLKHGTWKGDKNVLKMQHKNIRLAQNVNVY